MIYQKTPKLDVFDLIKKKKSLLLFHTFIKINK